jgi:hypothetical protein
MTPADELVIHLMNLMAMAGFLFLAASTVSLLPLLLLMQRSLR